MCKVVAFSNASKLDTRKSAEAIGNILLKLERDGFGYAVQGASNVFGEKCVASSFESRLDSSNVVRLPIVEVRQSTFGKIDKPQGPAIFHGRTSTNDKGLLNCHPMQRDGWHLIHNGVVTDHGNPYQKVTTNDSEDVLFRLMQGIEQVERHLTGYYAFAAIAPDGRLHVARDSQASLYVAWCPKIASYLFATTESLLKDVAKALKIKHGPIDKVRDDIYMIFNRQGDALDHEQAIKPRGFDRREASFASASLGRALYALDSAPASSGIVDATDYGNGYELPDDELEQDTELSELMAELEELDDSYRIINGDGEAISARAYYKLDPVAQSACTIERADGSRIEADAQWRWVR